MRIKLLSICLAVIGLGTFAVSGASAREVTPSPAMVAAMPSTVRVNEVDVSINTGSHRHYRHYGEYRHYHHGYYRHHRTVIYRHGRRIVIYR